MFKAFFGGRRLLSATRFLRRSVLQVCRFLHAIPQSDPAAGGPRRKMARPPLALVVALIVLLVGLSPLAPEANAQNVIDVEFDRVAYYDRNEDLIYRDYNVQEGATLRPVIKFSRATSQDATFTVLAQAGTAPAEASPATPGVDFPAGIHTITVPAGTIRHTFEIPIPWDAEIEDYENFTLTLQAPPSGNRPSGYNLVNKTAIVQIVNVTRVPSDWTLNPSGLSAGDQYRLLFKTGNTRNGASSNIDEYDAFVRERTNAHPWHSDIKKYADTFRVLGSVEKWVPGTQRRVDASWRTATGVNLLPDQPNHPGHTPYTTPIYWLNGVQIAPDYNEFWIGAWGDANAHANQRHADGRVATTTQGPFTGTLDQLNNKSLIQHLAGTHQKGRSLGTRYEVAYGNDGPAPDRDHSAIWIDLDDKDNLRPYFGMSAVYEVGDFQTSDPVISIEGLVRVRKGEGTEAETAFGDAEFTVNAIPAPSSDLTININVRESNAAGIDYVDDSDEGDRTIVIPAGQRTVMFTVPTKAKNRNEPDGLVIASIRPGTGYAVADHTELDGQTSGEVARVRRSWFATEIHTAQLISNIGQESEGGTNGNLGFDWAQSFTTGSHTQGYTVNSVDVYLSENFLDDLFRTNNPRIVATIREASNGIPGKTVGALTLPDSSPIVEWPLTVTFAAPAKGIKLSPSTTYFFVLDVQEEAPGRDAKLRFVFSDAENAGGAAGFSIGNRILIFANWHNPPRWDSFDRNMQISINGKLNPITDFVQMSNETRRVAEWGYTATAIVEVGDGLALHGSSRSINYTVGGTATRGSGKDYTIDGCASSTCSVILRGNTKSARIVIRLNDDGIDEDDETVVITLQDGNGYTVNTARNTTTVTLPDNDTRGLYFSRSWADMDEGGSHTYTVKLRSQPTAAVTVNIVSNNQDVTVSPTSLTFNPSGSNRWSRAQAVTISAAQDNDAVDDMAILTHTTSGGDYGGANALSIGRQIEVDDDDTETNPGPQLPAITVTGGAAVTEGNPASFTVSANPAPTSSLNVSVDVSEPPDVDFVAANQERSRTVTLNAGASSTTFTVPTVNDNTDEDDSFVQVYVNDGAGYTAGSGGAVTIRDNDDPIPEVSFSAESASVSENEGTRNVQVTLSYPALSSDFTLRYNVAGTATRGNSADYTVPNTVSVNAGAGSVTIPVTIRDDSSNENDETVILTLIGGTGYTLGSARVHTLTITDNDSATQPAVTFIAASSSAAEDAGAHEVHVDLGQTGTSSGLSVSYSVSGTATAGSGNDFTIQNSGSLMVDGGASGGTITVTINDDSSNESAETVILTLTDGNGYTLGSTTSHTLTISDNDTSSQPAASFALASSSVEEDAGAQYVRVNLSPAAPSGGLTVGYTVSGTATSGSGNDFTIQNSGALSIGAGATSATIPVAINDDSTQEGAETVILTLTDGSGYTLGSARVHTLTITANDDPSQLPVASFAAASSSAAESAGTRNVTVNLSPAAPSGGLTVNYTVSGTATSGGSNDFTIQNSGALTIGAGATSASIPVAIRDDSAQESDETVILTLTGGTGYTPGSPNVYTLTITDNDSPPPTQPAASFASASSSAAENSGTRSVAVNLSSAAPSGGLTVRYSVSGTATAGGGNDFTIQGSGTLSIAGGSTTANIPVVINDDTTQEGAETVILTLNSGTGYTLGSTRVHTLTITANDDPSQLRLQPPSRRRHPARRRTPARATWRSTFPRRRLREA